MAPNGDLAMPTANDEYTDIPATSDGEVTTPAAPEMDEDEMPANQDDESRGPSVSSAQRDGNTGTNIVLYVAKPESKEFTKVQGFAKLRELFNDPDDEIAENIRATHGFSSNLASNDRCKKVRNYLTNDQTEIDDKTVPYILATYCMLGGYIPTMWNERGEGKKSGSKNPHTEWGKKAMQELQRLGAADYNYGFEIFKDYVTAKDWKISFDYAKAKEAFEEFSKSRKAQMASNHTKRSGSLGKHGASSPRRSLATKRQRTNTEANTQPQESEAQDDAAEDDGVGVDLRALERALDFTLAGHLSKKTDKNQVLPKGKEKASTVPETQFNKATPTPLQKSAHTGKEDHPRTSKMQPKQVASISPKDPARSRDDRGTKDSPHDQEVPSSSRPTEQDKSAMVPFGNFGTGSSTGQYGPNHTTRSYGPGLKQSADGPNQAEKRLSPSEKNNSEALGFSALTQSQIPAARQGFQNTHGFGGGPSAVLTQSMSGFPSSSQSVPFGSFGQRQYQSTTSSERDKFPTFGKPSDLTQGNHFLRTGPPLATPESIRSFGYLNKSSHPCVPSPLQPAFSTSKPFPSTQADLQLDRGNHNRGQESVSRDGEGPSLRPNSNVNPGGNVETSILFNQASKDAFNSTAGYREDLVMPGATSSCNVNPSSNVREDEQAAPGQTGPGTTAGSKSQPVSEARPDKPTGPPKLSEDGYQALERKLQRRDETIRKKDEKIQKLEDHSRSTTRDLQNLQREIEVSKALVEEKDQQIRQLTSNEINDDLLPDMKRGQLVAENVRRKVHIDRIEKENEALTAVVTAVSTKLQIHKSVLAEAKGIGANVDYVLRDFQDEKERNLSLETQNVNYKLDIDRLQKECAASELRASQAEDKAKAYESEAKVMHRHGDDRRELARRNIELEDYLVRSQNEKALLEQTLSGLRQRLAMPLLRLLENSEGGGFSVGQENQVEGSSADLDDEDARTFNSFPDHTEDQN